MRSVVRSGGGGIWNSPTVDPVRGAIYFGTAMRRLHLRPKRQTPLSSIDINTGKLLWSYQADENDVYMGGCNPATPSGVCPTPNGPDLDIGNSPILKTLQTASAF